VSPPHSNENLFGNDYTITAAGDDKCSFRNERQQARNHKVDLSKAPQSSSSSSLALVNMQHQQQQQQRVNNNDGERASSKGVQSTVITGDMGTAPNSKLKQPNSTSTTDAEQRIQVSHKRPFPYMNVITAFCWQLFQQL